MRFFLFFFSVKFLGFKDLLSFCVWKMKFGHLGMAYFQGRDVSFSEGNPKPLVSVFQCPHERNVP